MHSSQSHRVKSFKRDSIDYMNVFKGYIFPHIRCDFLMVFVRFVLAIFSLVLIANAYLLVGCECLYVCSCVFIWECVVGGEGGGVGVGRFSDRTYYNILLYTHGFSCVLTRNCFAYDVAIIIIIMPTTLCVTFYVRCDGEQTPGAAVRDFITIPLLSFQIFICALSLYYITVYLYIQHTHTNAERARTHTNTRTQTAPRCSQPIETDTHTYSAQYLCARCGAERI